MPKPLEQSPIAFLSDIHGNLPALEAVLAELDRLGVSRVFVAGDHLLGGEQPLEVWRMLRERDATLARGVGDTALATVDPESLAPEGEGEAEMAERFRATRRAVGDLVLEELRRLPEKVRLPMLDGREVLMVHGAPSDPQQEITHDLSDEEVLALVADDPADVVVCGASHVPFLRDLDDIQVVNVGSVGAAPEGRVAHFAIVTPRYEGPLVEQAWVEY